MIDHQPRSRASRMRQCCGMSRRGFPVAQVDYPHRSPGAVSLPCSYESENRAKRSHSPGAAGEAHGGAFRPNVGSRGNGIWRRFKPPSGDILNEFAHAARLCPASAEDLIFAPPLHRRGTAATTERTARRALPEDHALPHWSPADLLRPSAFPHPVGRLEIRETNISWIVLTGSYAYKIKKSVDLGFIDTSTLAKRNTCVRRNCDSTVVWPPTYMWTWWR